MAPHPEPAAGDEVRRRLQSHLAAHCGVIDHVTALRLGASRGFIRWRVHSGEWVAAHRGVYVAAVSPASPERDLVAALAATSLVVRGGQGVRRRSTASPHASHASAAWLLGLSDHPPATVHVTVPHPEQHCLDGQVVVHRSIRPGPVIRVRGIPCTDATRTLIDVAPSSTAEQLDDMIDRALSRQLTALPRLLNTLRGDLAGARGAGALRRRLKDRGFTGGPPPSVLEARARRLLRRAGWTNFRVQLQVDSGGRRFRLDFADPVLRLVVEVKGYAWHSSPEDMARDDWRQNGLVTGGWTFLSFDWRAITQRPGEVTDTVAGAVRRLTATPPPAASPPA
jgi:very-short-patch-repair endonuclease